MTSASSARVEYITCKGEEHRYHRWLAERRNKDNSDSRHLHRPILAEAARGRLMPTGAENRFAEALLVEIDELVSASTPDAYAESDPAAESWGWEAERDMGLSPEGLVRAWHAGSPMPDLFVHQWSGGQPCNDNSPSGLVRTATGDSAPPAKAEVAVVQEAVPARRGKRDRKTGKVLRVARKKKTEVTRLVRVGNLRISEDGVVVPFDRRGADWTRRPKGRSKKTGESADVVKLDDYRPNQGVHYQEQYSATAAWQARNAVHERLLILKYRLGKEAYEALLDAATGMEPWRIGNGRDRHDWRAAAYGKALVVEAIQKLMQAV